MNLRFLSLRPKSLRGALSLLLAAAIIPVILAFVTLQRNWQRNLFSIELELLVLCLMISIIIVVTISRSLLKDLRELHTHVTAFDINKPNFSWQISRICELNDLKTAFDIVTSQIKKRAEELERTNTLLSTEIKNRINLEKELKQLASFPYENPSPVMRIAATGELLYANPASEQLLKEWRCKKGQRVPHEIMVSAARALETGLCSETETILENKTYSLKYFPLLEPGYVNLYGYDLTERKEAEESLKRSNKDLEQFAYISSHDLQEPLRMISGYLDLLSRRYKGKLDKEADEFIGYAVEGAMRMQQLINDLLVFSRVGNKEIWMTSVNLKDALEMALLNLKSIIEANSAVITSEQLPMATVDLPQMVQLFQNLIGNAIKFRKKDLAPRITVTALKTGRFWRIGVSDNGIGMDPAYTDRIFKVFQRLHTRAEYPGTGIGLAICKRIVERNRGQIWVEAEKGKGATFYFTVRE
ncbi:MAG: ATP-binding protein [Chitinispirillaceae bacterium]|jgi:signal transduction histidine kinase|nr:ATP-binding protein [Chitinispirillaceae bacterium]